MTTPHLFQVSELVNWTNTCKTLHPEAGWIPMRPVGYQGLTIVRRLKIALGVFTGRYDAVTWEPSVRVVDPPRAEKMYPTKVDLSEQASTCVDQEQLNASAACAITAAYAGAGLDTGAGILPYMYYNERAIDEHERKQ